MTEQILCNETYTIDFDTVGCDLDKDHNGLHETVWMKRRFRWEVVYDG